jgi:hypothetical protein
MSEECPVCRAARRHAWLCDKARGAFAALVTGCTLVVASVVLAFAALGAQASAGSGALGLALAVLAWLAAVLGVGVTALTAPCVLVLALAARLLRPRTAGSATGVSTAYRDAPRCLRHAATG